MALVTVVEASRRLGLTQDTVKRRLRKGALQGERLPRPQGYVWFVEVEDKDPQGDDSVQHGGENGTVSAQGAEGVSNEVRRLEEIVTMLQNQVTVHQQQLEVRGREVEQLHVLLGQAQAALPAPREGRRWWRVW